MRAHHRVRMLAAVAAAVGLAAPPAVARTDYYSDQYSPVNATQNVAHQPGDDASEWPLIGAGIGAVALLGGGAVTARRSSRRTSVRTATRS